MDRKNTARKDLRVDTDLSSQCHGAQSGAVLSEACPDSAWSSTLANSSTGSHTRHTSETSFHKERPKSQPSSPYTHESTPHKDQKGARKQSAEVNANGFSRLIFEWASGLLWRGFRKPLELHELPLVHPERRAQPLVDVVQNSFDNNIRTGRKHALFWALYGVFKKEFWMGGICRGMADILLVVTPYTLRYLIQFSMDAYVAHLSNKPGPPLWHGIAYLSGIITMLVIQSLTHNHYMYLLGVIGGQSRAILTSAIFNKSVRVLEKGKPLERDGQEGQETDNEDYTSSLVAGFISFDCARISQTASAIHILWTAPLSLTTALSLLIVNLRLSALAGFGVLVLGFAGLVLGVGTLFRQRKSTEKSAESRISLTHEILNAIRPVKFFGWEEGFAQQIREIRATENRKLNSYTTVKSAVGAISQGLPVLIAMMSFITFALTHSGLSPAIVFSSTALFASLRMPLIYLPLCIQACKDSGASMSRIQKFLSTHEIKENEVDPVLNAAVELNHANFVWGDAKKSDTLVEGKAEGSTIVLLPTRNAPKPAFRLRDIDLTIERGELLAVIGSVGSGKTSFLSALAGDMARISGTVRWGASHALCPEQPWMLNGTVRDNILFGRPFERQWYNAVLQACSLTRDLGSLPHGDQTVVGERGVVLSGGQKQRISLARAMYSEKDVILLDDPLSAVDANVGGAIMDDAICGKVLCTKTRILCTHNMSVLHNCDRILWLEGGTIRFLGSFSDLQNNAEFSSIGSSSDDDKQHFKPIVPSSDSVDLNENTDADTTDNLIQDEDQETRSVSWKVYGSLFVSPGSAFFAILCFPLLLAGSGCMVLAQLWLAWWSSGHFEIHRNIYIYIYVALGCGQILFLYLFGVLVALCCTRASQVLLNKAVARVFHAPTHFFDSTPAGRLTNRFSSDVEAMDYHLPEALRMFSISTSGLTALFALVIAYFHWFGIAIGVLIVVIVFLAIYYRSTAREVKRHESTLRSAMYTRFMEGVSGISTLRVFGMHRHFSQKLCEAADDLNSASFTTFAVQRWLSLRQDAAAILLVTAMGVLVLVDRHSQNPAISGLVLSLMLSAVQVIQVVVREWADVESALNSTERLYEYAHNIPQEPDHNVNPPIEGWPRHGQVEFAETRMRYRPGLPEALKGVNLRVSGGEHVAIVGRTGAGKSSIVNALFRLTELSGGLVSIDGHDISRVSLQDLRSHALSIIPQETALFAGTIRSNLDPFDELPDSTIWEALKGAGLDRTVHPSDIVREEGTNFSLGQKQLLAVARVLTRTSRIVVCDEATAALDTETDDQIQATMHRAFRNRTVLCIAHRLRTVLWYDRICVMDTGQVAELDTPLGLYQKQDSIFREMCLKVGITEEQIINAAQLSRMDVKTPLLELNLPSSKIEIDWDNLALPISDDKMSSESSNNAVMFSLMASEREGEMSATPRPRPRSKLPPRRMRSMRSRSAQRSSSRYSGSVVSWSEWENAFERDRVTSGIYEMV
ncbi:P-loop containing nucleoside triphosphate hydrolase protein [Ophiobolus disseminans]|uniref:P-loop containing nucleoside triphosphate hydrolase protein n=1 Tax=Ophiobolus disseminans TaxID=1469910 RepID=A0A6A6ZKW4_9PLEO|nr:P-loop containing nucleoside triphosphate hydrolase protein [Ophiobolus disseminans]